MGFGSYIGLLIKIKIKYEFFIMIAHTASGGGQLFCLKLCTKHDLRVRLN